MDTVAKRIAFARQRANLTQSELARRMGINPQSVNMWERQDKMPGRENLVRLAEITKASVEWLLFGEGLSEHKWNRYDQGIVGRGRTIPMISPEEAVSGVKADENTPYLPVHFACGQRTYFVTLPDDSNAPQHPAGSRWAIDPDHKPRPGRLVLAAAGTPPIPVFGEFRVELSPNGHIQIVVPLNAKWPQARSDSGSFVLLGTMTEHIQQAI